MKKKQKKVIVAKKDKDHPSATRHLTSGNKSFRDKSDSYSFSATSSKKSTPNTSNLSSFVEKSDGDFSKLMSSNYHEKMKNVRERDLISTMNLSMRPKTTAQLFPNQNPLLSKTLSSTVKTSNPSIPRVCFTNIQRIQNNKTQLVKKSSGRDTPENLKKRFANTGDLNKIKLIYKQIATSSSLDTTNENNAFMFNQEGTIPIYNSAGNLNQNMNTLNDSDLTDESYFDTENPGNRKTRKVKKSLFYYHHEKDENGLISMKKYRKSDYTSASCSDSENPGQRKKKFIKKSNCIYATIPNPSNPKEKITKKFNRDEYTSESCSNPENPNKRNKKYVKKSEFLYETVFVPDPDNPSHTHKIIQKTKLNDPKFVFEEYSDPENPGEKKLRKLNKEEFTSEEYSDPDHPNQMKKRFVKKNEFYYRKVSHPNNPTQKIIQKVRLNDPKFFFETVPDPKNPGKTKVLCFEIGIDCELESYSDPENPGQRKQQIKKLLNPKFQKYQKFTKINKETNTNTKKAKDFSIEKDKDQVDLNIQPPPLPLRLLPLCDAFAQTSPKPKHIFIKTTVDIPKRPETPKANPPHIRFENDGMIDTFHAVYTKIMPHTTCEIPPDPNFPPTRRGYKNNLSIPNNFSTPSSMRNITRTTIANVESRITKKPAMTFGATPGTISISKSPYSQNTMKTRNGIEFDSPDFDFDSFENQPSFLSFAGLTKFEHMNRVIKNMATHANEKSKQQPSRSQQNPHNVSPRRRTPKP